MKVMNEPGPDPRDKALCLKESSGWFAAGSSFRRALAVLSDGAFKLFAYICLQADRRTGRYEAVQAELATAIGKSRRIVGKYVEELEPKGVHGSKGNNQYARTSFEIRDEYWPYHRVTISMAPRCTMRMWTPSGAALFPSVALPGSSAREMRRLPRSSRNGVSHWNWFRTPCSWEHAENTSPGSMGVRRSRSGA